jgi:hypothetical protein
VVSSYTGTDLFPGEDEAQEWCDLMLSRYSQQRPILRLTYVATSSATMRSLALARRLSDKVRVVANGDTGMGIDADFYIESIAHRLTEAGKLWTVTVELSPAF